MPDENTLILVEFEKSGSMRRVTKDEVDPEELAQLSGKSREAVEKALSAIGWISGKARDIISAAHEQPDQVELEFGIKITTGAGILVMESSGEFHIKAKVVWKKSDNEE